MIRKRVLSSVWVVTAVLVLSACGGPEVTVTPPARDVSAPAQFQAGAGAIVAWHLLNLANFQGTPVIAEKKEAEAIIKKVANRSKRYHTKIVYRDGIGVIEF